MRTTPILRNLSRPSAALLDRVRRPAYLAKLAQPEDLVPLFKVSLVVIIGELCLAVADW